MAQVILVDPDSVVARSIAKLLGALGHVVTRARTVEEAALDALLEPVDLLVTSTSLELPAVAELGLIARRRQPRCEHVVYGPRIVDGEDTVWHASGATHVLSTFAFVEDLLERLSTTKSTSARLPH